MFTMPTLNYAQLAPILVVLGGALLGVLVEAFLGKKQRGPVQTDFACRYGKSDEREGLGPRGGDPHAP